MVAVTGQRLVDGVVHDLIDQMVQAAGAGGADIHARALAHRFQAFQDLDLGTGAVLVVGRGLRGWCSVMISFAIWLPSFPSKNLFSLILRVVQV